VSRVSQLQTTLYFGVRIRRVFDVFMTDCRGISRRLACLAADVRLSPPLRTEMH